MYKITNVQTRPNLSVEFWTRDNPSLTAEYVEYYRNTYINTGKHIHLETDVSSDGLSLTTVTIWDSEATVISWREDPICQAGFFEPRTAYLEANGITTTRSEEEI